MLINCAFFNLLLQDVFAKRLKLYFVCNLVASNELSINMPFLWNEKEIWPKSICSLFCMNFSSVWDSMAIKLAPNEAQMSWEWDKHVYCLRLIQSLKNVLNVHIIPSHGLKRIPVCCMLTFNQQNERNQNNQMIELSLKLKLKKNLKPTDELFQDWVSFEKK